MIGVVGMTVMDWLCEREGRVVIYLSLEDKTMKRSEKESLS